VVNKTRLCTASEKGLSFSKASEMCPIPNIKFTDVTRRLSITEHLIMIL